MSGASQYPELIQGYAEYFSSGGRFENISEARQYASTIYLKICMMWSSPTRLLG